MRAICFGYSRLTGLEMLGHSGLAELAATVLTSSS
jgi:hypothetical protein